MVRFLGYILMFISLSFGQGKGLFINQEEAERIRRYLNNFDLLLRSYEEIRDKVDREIVEIIVPLPGEAGSYAHERHKLNGWLVRNAGILYLITGEEKYLRFISDILLRYADMYPKLSANPFSKSSAPGKIFHQMLNEAVWLTDVIIGYDCVKRKLSSGLRVHLIKNLFIPMVEWFSVKNEHEFNRIHNHGTWAVAAVGMTGYAIGDTLMVKKALYGTGLDGKGGFLTQLKKLFSPDGYYIEGPYYARYAIQPFYLFAECIERNQPELKIFAYRDSILKKAVYALLQVTYPNGLFPPLNDASRTMSIRNESVILAVDIALYRYGLLEDKNMLSVVKFQNRVVLHEAALHIVEALGNLEDKRIRWGSVRFRDGSDGEKGGIAVLRVAGGLDSCESVVVFKYGAHGMEHGHFDKLHFTFYDQGREVITDYGYCRWINVEPKFGGRYLPENRSYAMQTVAHNTIVVDESSHFGGDYERAEASGCRERFYEFNDSVKVVSAEANECYDGVKMQRTIFLMNLSLYKYPIIVDIFRVYSERMHKYDYVLHHNGQIIEVNVKFKPNTTKLVPVGVNFGYQHIWDLGRGRVTSDTVIRVTWLDGQRYYSFLSSGSEGDELILGKLGANDPNFNLRHEPLIILRRFARSTVFVSVIEPHGYFDESTERSDEAFPRTVNVKVLGHSDEGVVIRITSDKGGYIFMLSNLDDPERLNVVETEGGIFRWRGFYKILLLNGK